MRIPPPFNPYIVNEKSNVTLLDLFAGFAMVGMLSNSWIEQEVRGGDAEKRVADWNSEKAYEIAEAMLRARTNTMAKRTRDESNARRTARRDDGSV